MLSPIANNRNNVAYALQTHASSTGNAGLHPCCMATVGDSLKTFLKNFQPYPFNIQLFFVPLQS